MPSIRGGGPERSPRFPRQDDDIPSLPPTMPPVPLPPDNGPVGGPVEGMPDLPPSPLPPSPDDPLAGIIDYGPTPSNSNLPLALPGAAGGTFTTPDQPNATAFRQRPMMARPASRMPMTAQTGIYSPSLMTDEDEGLPQRLGKVMFKP